MTRAERRLLIAVTQLLLMVIDRAVPALPSWVLAKPERERLAAMVVEIREAVQHVDDKDLMRTDDIGGHPI